MKLRISLTTDVNTATITLTAIESTTPENLELALTEMAMAIEGANMNVNDALFARLHSVVSTLNSLASVIRIKYKGD